MKKFKTITIKSADNGIIVDVGCVTFIFSRKDYEEFFVDLHNYICNTEEFEKTMNKKYRVKDMGQEVKVDYSDVK